MVRKNYINSLCMNCKAEVLVNRMKAGDKAKDYTCPMCNQVHRIKKTKNTVTKRVIKDGDHSMYGKFL